MLSFLAIYIRTLFWNLEYPYNTFLSPPISRFGDLYSLIAPWKQLGFSGIGYAHSYFPGMYLFFEIFDYANNLFAIPGIWSLMILLFLTAFLTCYVIYRNLLLSISLFMLMVFSVPTLLIWSTGNLEAFVAYFLMLGTICLYKNKYYLFCIFIAIAGSMKLFPIIFILILFHKLKFKSFLKYFGFTLFVFLGIFLFSILFLRGGILTSNNSIWDIISNSSASRNMYASLMYFTDASIPYGHSFLNGIHSLFGMNFIPTSTYMYHVAFFITFFLFLPCLFVLKYCKSPDWIVMIILGIFTLTAVPTSTDYRLIYLWPALILSLVNKSIILQRSFIIIAITIILIPKPYFPTDIHPQAYLQVYSTSFAFIVLPILITYIELRINQYENKNNQIFIR